MFRFGSSTRLFVLCGPEELVPEEYDSERLQQLRQRSKRRQEQQVQRKQVGGAGRRGVVAAAGGEGDVEEEEEEEGATWGMGPDLVAEEEEDEGGEGAHEAEDLLNQFDVRATPPSEQLRPPHASTRPAPRTLTSRPAPLPSQESELPEYLRQHLSQEREERERIGLGGARVTAKDVRGRGAGVRVGVGGRVLRVALAHSGVRVGSVRR